jgi:hypothetical protein
MCEKACIFYLLSTEFNGYLREVIYSSIHFWMCVIPAVLAWLSVCYDFRYVYVNAYIHIYTHIYVHTYVHIHTYAHIHTCMHAYISTSIHAYISHEFIHNLPRESSVFASLPSFG